MLLRLRPAGSVPAGSENVKGAVPPVAVIGLFRPAVIFPGAVLYHETGAAA